MVGGLIVLCVCLAALLVTEYRGRARAQKACDKLQFEHNENIGQLQREVNERKAAEHDRDHFRDAHAILAEKVQQILETAEVRAQQLISRELQMKQACHETNNALELLKIDRAETAKSMLTSAIFTLTAEKAVTESSEEPQASPFMEELAGMEKDEA